MLPVSVSKYLLVYLSHHVITVIPSFCREINLLAFNAFRWPVPDLSTSNTTIFPVSVAEKACVPPTWKTD